MRLIPALVIAALMGSGCSAFMAGYREPYVRNITLGMTTSGVLSIAGAPQRREAVASPSGPPVEVWYYHVTAPGGGFEERPIGFSNGQVVAVGQDGMKSLATQQPAQAQAALYQAFVAAYLAGYRQGQTDRDAEWTATVQKIAPQIEDRVKKAEAAGYTAGQQAGEKRAMDQVQASFEQYLREAQEEERKQQVEQRKRFGL